MNVFIGTLFPQLYTSFLDVSIIGRAIKKNLISVDICNMLNFVSVKERVDAPIVGHGDGMIIGVSVIEKLYDKVIEKAGKKPYTIFFSPHGKKLDQSILKKIYDNIASTQSSLLVIAGRYEGIDARAEEYYADEVISIGNYVLCGGDLPILVFLEGLFRLKSGVIGKKESVENDSFYNLFLDCPHFSNPDVWKEKQIPSVLKSGDHKKISEWRKQESVARSVLNAWKWISERVVNKSDKCLIKESLPNHYCVLLHNDVMLPHDLEGESSVTSIDIHDIARTSTTYGIREFFVVTRLQAQQEIVKKFLNFWHDDEKNKKVNESRSFALKNVAVFPELADVIEAVYAREGVMPITMVTSSRKHIQHRDTITFHDQGMIWAKKRPIIFIFGTAHGLSPRIIESCDYRLVPLEGLEEFNFLSVRSAAAVVIDRWLGCNTIIKNVKINEKYINKECE